MDGYQLLKGLQTTIITKNGTIGYLAAMYAGRNSIFEYNLTTAIPTLKGTFNNNGINITLDKMELTNKYLLLYSSSNTIVHYYNLTSRMRVGTFNLAESTR
jgi:hypothetical protein